MNVVRGNRTEHINFVRCYNYNNLEGGKRESFESASVPAISPPPTQRIRGKGKGCPIPSWSKEGHLPRRTVAVIQQRVWFLPAAARFRG